MSARIHHRTIAALAVVAILVAACQASAASSSPVATSTPGSPVARPSRSAATPPAAPTPVVASPSPPLATPVPSSTQSAGSPAPAASWVPAGSMIADWFGGTATPVGGGGALALASDGTSAQRWDPATATWRAAATLNAPRSNYAAVQLHDGRVLVVGGANDARQAYSSAYAYDPMTPMGTWTKVGLMGTARSAPAAAVLADGRVLVAGGAYVDKPALRGPAIPAAALVAYRPGPGAGAGAQGRSDDIAPSHQVPALATAEIFDPATGTWSPTGAMRFARAGATAVTLTDGRVLVVSPGGELWVATDTGASLDPRASGTTEIYDAATGRFTLAGDIPAFDRAAIAAAGVVLPDTSPWQVSTGTLVALPDGGALLVGRSDAWKHEGSVTRTLRFDAGTARWTQVGPAYACLTDFTANGSHCTPGVDLTTAFAAALPDGRVLAAGGWTATAGGGTDASRQAQAFDATTSAWSPLPAMPDARASGRTAVLSDGSVLLVGGNDSSAGPVTAVRFVLSP